MAQHSERPRWSVGHAQYRGNAVAMAIVKGQGFFHNIVLVYGGGKDNYYSGGRTPKAQASLAVKRVKLPRSRLTVTQVAI